MTLNITDETILDCGHKPSAHSEHATGYGETRDGSTFCYECAAKRDIEEMKSMGRSRSIPLYLSKRDDGIWHVTNWPGSLEFVPFEIRDGRHNIAGSRTDVWFDGPDGHVWHGVQYGEWTQICHCRRTRELTY